MPSRDLRRSVVVALCVLLAPGPAAHARRGRSVDPTQAQLTSWLTSHELTTRIPMGAGARYATSSGVMMRKVCTVVHEDGHVSYLMPVAMNGFAPLVAQPIGLGECDAVLPAGVAVRIGKVDFDPERIEIAVLPGRGQACLRVRLAPGWEEAGLLDLLDAFASAFDLGPDYEELRRLDARWPGLTAAVDDAEARASAPGMSASAELAANQALLSALQDARDNREELGRALGSRLPEAEDFARRTEGVQARIEELHRVRAQELQDELRGRMTEDASAHEEALARLEAAGGSSDLERRLALLDEASAARERRAGSRRELEAIGGGLTEEEASRLASDEGRHDRLSGELEGQRRARDARARSERLEKAASEGRALAARVERCDPAAGMDACRSLLRQWSETLQARERIAEEMEAAGDAGAASVGAKLRDEASALARARQGLDARAESAALATLDAGYARMESERTALLRAYGMSMDTPEQGPKAAALGEHYHRMIANREDAQRRGSSTAPAQVASLRGYLETLRRANPGVR